MADSPEYDEKGMTRRQALKTGASLATATGLAGCGSNEEEPDTDYDDNETDTNGNTEPELKSVDVLLNGDTPETVDFREQDVLETGYTPVLQLEYSDGETEEIEINEEDYEVTEAYSKRTNGEEFYGTIVGDPDLPQGLKEEFDEETLRKAGFYQELENIDELDSDQLLAGFNEIGFTLQVDEQAIQNYTEQEINTENITSTIQGENKVEALKNHQATLEDNLPNKENAVELWRQLRSNNAEVGLTAIADGDGSTEAGFRNLYDLEEEVITYVDNPDDDREMLEQISQGWIENAGRATGSTPSSVSTILSDIVVRNTEMVPFITSNDSFNTVAVYDPKAGDIMHISSQGTEGEARYDIKNLYDFEEAENRNNSPILNPEKNAEQAQIMMDVMHRFLENDLYSLEGLADRETAVNFMDEIRENNAPGENIEEVREGMEANIQAAVANAMKTDPNLLFEFNQDDQRDYTVKMKDAEESIN